MFRRKIRETPFTNENAEDLFTIQGDSFWGDVSFLATLRALLHKRCNGTKVCLEVLSNECYRYAERTFDSLEVDAPAPVFGGENVLRVLSLNGSVEDNEAALRMYDDPVKGLVAAYPEFHEAEDLRLFVMNRIKLNARFYINTAKKETLVVCEDLMLIGYHLIQAFITRLLPWFFEDHPIDDTERALLTSLTAGVSTGYDQLINVLSTRIDFRASIIKRLISNFDKMSRQDQIENLEREISNYHDRMNDLNRQYQRLVEQLDECNIRLSAQEIALENASDDSELVDYFICHKDITPFLARNHRLSFEVKTFLEIFDPEQYLTYSRNANSCIYRGYEYMQGFDDAADRKKLLDAIFSDEPVLKVKICSNYTIDLRGQCDAERYRQYGAEYHDYIPNPHIHHYACLGNYRPIINNMIEKGNLLGAIEQCVASAKSLNLCEPHTTRYLLGDLFTSTYNVIRLPDGRDVTPLEALDYLKELEAQKEEANV